ncbi:MAG: hypothetical protein ACYCZW_03760 [Minisyncoccota bacterium]
MSIESPMEVGSPFSQGEIDAAKDLVENDPVLKDDVFANEVIENEGLLGTGEYVTDLGEFLDQRRKTLESGQAPASFEANMDNVGVVNSVRPDMERK